MDEFDRRLLEYSIQMFTHCVAEKDISDSLYARKWLDTAKQSHDLGTSAITPTQYIDAVQITPK